MAPRKRLVLRRVLRGDEHRPLGVRREGVGDAAEKSAGDGAAAALAADDKSGVNLLGNLIDRLVLATDSLDCAIRAEAL
jgi:hypothetical protein